MGVINAILWILFVLSAILLSAIVLLQEGKGGGLAEAFGGVGAEAFGVKAGGVSKVTSILAAIFLGSAILVASIHGPSAFRATLPPPTNSSLDNQAVRSSGPAAADPGPGAGNAGAPAPAPADPAGKGGGGD